MSKVTPLHKVERIPPVDSIREFSAQERKDYGIITSTGIQNAYRVAFALGQGASRKDTTYDRKAGIHTCCNSRVAWRHKVSCHLLNFEDES
jgi:hypothetical protein